MYTYVVVLNAVLGCQPFIRPRFESLTWFPALFSLRWPSFQISNRLSHSVASLQITSQSAAQLSLLQKFSLLRLTAIMEKYSMSNKHGWTW